jgi:antitoxin YefM
MINISAEKLEGKLSQYLDLVAYTDEIITASSENGNIVILSEQKYNNLMETLYLHFIPGMKERIIDGLNTRIEDCEESKE